MPKLKYVVNVPVAIEIDESRIASVLTDAWRGQFYDLRTPEDIAAHLAVNLVQDRPLTSLDGFADWKPDDATHDVLEVERWDVERVAPGAPGARDGR